MIESLDAVREREREREQYFYKRIVQQPYTQIKLNEKQAIKNSLVNVSKNNNTVI